MTCAYLIIGSGVAGLYTALQIAKRDATNSIVVICKGAVHETNTSRAQGGMAVVSAHGDSFAQHVDDTLKAGAFLNRADAVIAVVSECGEHLSVLEELGFMPDRNQDGQLSLGLEGGHSARRIVHCKDQTGLALQQVLIKACSDYDNINILEYTTALELIAEHGQCHGAVVSDNTSGQTFKIVSGKCILATGGAGQIFENSSNHPRITGDGIAMAARAGAAVSNMEFIQFHPTVHAGEDTFLVSEAVRGAGARIKNSAGETFMSRYDAQADLSTRDVVSRAIATELRQRAETYALLDCSAIGDVQFISQFPWIYNKISQHGLAIDSVPVVPGAHYLCGGISTDLNGLTSLENLYACGECADTGLHGANRLASNSLTEALVFSARCAEHAVNHFTNMPEEKNFQVTADQENLLASTYQTAGIQNKIRQVMSEAYGAFTSNGQLENGRSALKAIREEIAGSKMEMLAANELRNMAEVGILVLEAALQRTENAGCYYNVDLASEDFFRTSIDLHKQ